MTDHQNPTDTPEPTDALAAAWADQGDLIAPPSTTNLTELAGSVATAHKADQRRLLWLNIQEFIPALAVAAVFALAAPAAMRPWAAFAAAAIALGVGCFLVVSSVRHHRADRNWGGTVRDQLTRRLVQVRHRAGLYRTVAWWYLLPLAIAIVLFRYGVAGEVRLGAGDIAYYGFCLAFFAGLYWLNRKVGRTRYEPEALRLEGLLAEFDRTA